MFPGEEKDREVVLRVITATKSGRIRWRKNALDFEQIFHATWRGWKLTAMWLQDETAFEMRKKGHEIFRTSYRVMEGLREAIVQQIDPDWEEKAKRDMAKRQELADKQRSARDKAREAILKL